MRCSDGGYLYGAHGVLVIDLHAYSRAGLSLPLKAPTNAGSIGRSNRRIRYLS